MKETKFVLVTISIFLLAALLSKKEEVIHTTEITNPEYIYFNSGKTLIFE